MTAGDDDFGSRYGPWAVVAGASDGVGAAMAWAAARRGVNVMLLARRRPVLDELAAAIHTATGVEARVLVVDLSHDDAADQVVAATADLDVGLVLYCAGADPNYAPFLDQPIDAAVAMVQRNCMVPVRLCHHFAAPMVARGRGGIVLVGSGAGLAGGPNMVAYGSSKAFDMVLGEALWAELHPRGVDVLSLVLAVTDTPALRRLLAARGVLSGPDDASPIPGAVTAEAVADDMVAHLADGPTWFVGEMAQMGADVIRGMTRGDAVRLMIDSGGGVMGGNRENRT